VTHARLRAQQGDRQGAVKILLALLQQRPGDREARELLANLPGGPGLAPEIEEPAVAPPTPASARELAGAFRRTLDRPQAARGRLARFLAAVTRHAR
jgi:Flp pilus assembly protein TadD